MFVQVDHKDAGELTVLANPIHMDRYPMTYSKAAPDLGEHNQEVLEEFGFNEDKIQEFKEGGAI